MNLQKKVLLKNFYKVLKQKMYGNRKFNELLQLIIIKQQYL